MSNTNRFQFVVDSPIGPVGVSTSHDRLNGVEFLDRSSKPFASDAAFAAEVVKQLNSYFMSGSAGFCLELNLSGTDFQRRVWQALARIKLGEVRTYGDIAKELNTSPRAVGNACRSNPVPIVIPCHRVVSARSIGGFAGATRGERLNIKRWLLNHEGIYL